jgi:hypothetical protein
LANGSPNAPQDAPPADVGQQPSVAAPALTATAPTQAGPKPTISDEARRRNRERYIERYEARQYQEPRYKEYYEPRYKERYVAPRYVEPRYVEPRYVEPRHYVPRDGYSNRYNGAPNYGQRGY